MTDGVLVSGGDYALEIFHDEVTFTDIRQLVPAVFVDGNWSSRKPRGSHRCTLATINMDTLHAPIWFIVEDKH